MASVTRLGNRRKTGKEQYYTPPATAAMVVDRLHALRPDCLSAPWIEPAGGTGTFVDQAHRLGVAEVVSFDIEPHHPDVVEGDFLQQDLHVQHAVAIGNPPFGRNNSLSIPFFNHCAAYSDIICFIVPRSWRKWSVINRLQPNFHLIEDYDLAIDYLDVDGSPISARGNLRTVVQTWERSETIRNKIVVRDLGVVRKTDPVSADVSLTIFGYSCGSVKTDFPRKSNTTQMFLSLHHPRALEALRAVDFSRFFNNTAYTEALSFQEINYLLNDYLFDDPNLESGRPDVIHEG